MTDKERLDNIDQAMYSHEQRLLALEGSKKINTRSMQDVINEWQWRVFGSRQSIKGLINHLKKEIDELEESNAAEEIADCQILLYGIADKLDYDLDKITKDKYNVIIHRTCGEPDADGVIEHIEPEPRDAELDVANMEIEDLTIENAKLNINLTLAEDKINNLEKEN